MISDINVYRREEDDDSRLCLLFALLGFLFKRNTVQQGFSSSNGTIKG
jgi:hypothetical protein